MNSALRRGVLAVVLTALSWNVSAESGAYPLTFAAAIRQALANRTELAVEEANIESSGARVAEAKGAFLPSLDAVATVQRVKAYDDFSGVSINANYNGLTIPISVVRSTPPYQVGSGIELTYNLYSGGVRQARVNATMAAMQAAQAQRAVARNRLVLDISSAYWGLRKAQILRRKTALDLDHARQEEEVAREQFNQARIAGIDVDEKKLAVESRRFDLRNAERSVQDCQRRYAHALGMSRVAAAPEAMAMLERPEDIEVDKIVADFGLMREPETYKAQAELASANARIDQVNAEYKPVLDVFARYTGVGRSEHGLVDAQSAFGGDASFLGLRLKWNWFDGFRSDHRVAQAVASSEQMRLMVRQTQRELSNDYQEKLSREATLQDQLLLAGRRVELSRAQLNIAGKRAEMQLISNLQYRAAQLALEAASTHAENLQIDLLLARIATQLARVD